jgi:plasmid stabilization system protein ParE
MAYTIKQHPLVEGDLLGVAELVADYAGIEVANRKVDEIVDFIDRLADHPHIGTVREDLFPGLRAIPASKKAVVCFTVDESAKEIVVICISYAGSDWQAKVQERR